VAHVEDPRKHDLKEPALTRERVTGIEPAWPAWKGGVIDKSLTPKYLIHSYLSLSLPNIFDARALYGHFVSKCRREVS
jgi:hypothetical protein